MGMGYMRSLLASLGGTTGAFAAAGVCAAALGVGYWVQSTRNAEPAVQESARVPQVQTPAPTAAPAPAAIAPIVQDTAQEPATDPVQEAAVAPLPSFDEVRREADGVTLIAGKGAPGADISVLQNGSVVARAVADAAGKFATIALIPPDGKGHVLTLSQMAMGQKSASIGEIILAPLNPPVTVAALPDAEETDEIAPPAPVAQPVEQTEEIVVARAAPATPEVVKAPAAPATQIAPQTSAAPEPIAPEPTAPVLETPAPEESQTPAPTVAAAAPAQPDEASPAQQKAVSAPMTQEVAVLKATPDGVELLNTESPEVMENVAIDTISYSDVGEVQLAGRAQAEADRVRVYLNNRSVAELSVDAAGRWRGDLPDIDEGIYTLRVDEVSVGGTVTSRVETPFKREAPAVLAAATDGLEGPIKAITVQKGATLWAIARDRYGAGELYVRVFEANRAAIRDPDLIYPGQVFDLPQ
ncbi:MAG: peptigoglycan-binding protein LysM [Pseudomonadota bacterium]